MEPTMDSLVCLRNMDLDDLPRIYESQLDSESNRMAVTIPRSVEAFDAHWKSHFRTQTSQREQSRLAMCWLQKRLLIHRQELRFIFLLLWLRFGQNLSLRHLAKCMAPASEWHRHPYLQDTCDKSQSRGHTPRL